MKNVDLHIHTTFSDGDKSVDEVIIEARQKKLRAISITDHDNVKAYKTLDVKNKGIEILTGVELLTVAGGCAIEVLVYGFEYDKMNNFIKNFCPTREFESKTKTMRSIESFKQLGVKVNFDAENYNFNSTSCWIIRDYYNKLLTYKKAVELLKQEDELLLENCKLFFRRGLNNINSKFFVDMTDVCVGLKEIRKFCDDNKCLMFLAHPFEYGENINYVLNIAKNYVDGVEVYHPTAGFAERNFLKEFANKNNLLISGGSDYHGFRGPMDSEEVPETVYDNLIFALNKKRQSN